MPLFGVDIHPEYQAGISIEDVANEVDFMSVKLSEGLSSEWVGMGAADWIRRGKAAGLLCMGYHYLRPGNEKGQARVFANALAATGVPGVIDAEAVTITNGVTTPTLTMKGIRAFVAECRALHLAVPFIYLPRWYHRLLGSPPLGGLPAVWASSYPTNRPGPLSSLYGLVDDSHWSPYGGCAPAVLQFADCGKVAGRQVDVNAHQGTRAEFMAALGLTTQQESSVIELPATAMPRDITSDPATWPEVNRNVGWNIAGGFLGKAAISFGVQDWGGPASGVRGRLHMASWIIMETDVAKLVPVEDPRYTAGGQGYILHQHDLTPEYLAPDGTVGVTLNYSAPGGAYLAIGRSG